MARIITEGSDFASARMLRDVHRAVLPVAQVLGDAHWAMLPAKVPAAQVLRDVHRAMLPAMVPAAQVLRDVHRAMLPAMVPAAQVLLDAHSTLMADFGFAAQAARDVVLAGPSKAEMLDALRHLEDELRSGALSDSAPGSVRWSSDQLHTLTTYLIALHVLVVAAVLHAYHPAVVEAVANVLAWPAAVLMLVQALRDRR